MIDDKNFKVSNIVMEVLVRGTPNLSSIYELLPLVPIETSNGVSYIKNSKEKIPYFGIENVVVGIRFNGKSRGVREEGGQLMNVLSADFQILEKNVHIKLSTKKFLLTGLVSEEMGFETVQGFCETIYMTQSNIDYLDSLDKNLFDSTVDWVKKITKGASKGNGFLLNREFDLEIKTPSDVDKRAALILLVYCLDTQIKTHNEYMEKLERIISCDHKLYTEKIEFGGYEIHNAVYNYKLGYDNISLLKLVNHLCKKNMRASFHNWQAKRVNLAFPIIDVEDDPNKSVTFQVTSKGDLKAHRFGIYKSGTVRQCSPTSFEEAKEAFNELISALQDFKP